MKAWGGSAPRVRGTGATKAAAEMAGRFSPACAGNGSRSTIARRPTTVQPRVCGERIICSDWTHDACGSAPRVRGTVMM